MVNKLIVLFLFDSYGFRSGINHDVVDIMMTTIFPTTIPLCHFLHFEKGLIAQLHPISTNYIVSLSTMNSCLTASCLLIHALHGE